MVTYRMEDNLGEFGKSLTIRQSFLLPICTFWSRDLHVGEDRTKLRARISIWMYFNRIHNESTSAVAPTKDVLPDPEGPLSASVPT